MAQQTRKPEPWCHVQAQSHCTYARSSKMCENDRTLTDFLVICSHPLPHFLSFCGHLSASSPPSGADAADQTSAASPVSPQASAAAAAASSSPIALAVRPRAGNAAAVVRLRGRGAARRHETGMRLAERREYGVWRRAAASRSEDTEMAATEAPASPSTASRLPQL